MKKEAHPDAEDSGIEPHAAAEWAISRGLWQRPPLDPVEMLRRDLSRFLRSETTTDPQGRTVRLNHVILYVVPTADGLKKRSRWYKINEVPAPHMQASLQLRRRAALADVHQLTLDFESWNDNNVHGETLQPMDFDFNKDLDEMKEPTHYPMEAPDIDDDDEEI